MLASGRDLLFTDIKICPVTLAQYTERHLISPKVKANTKCSLECHLFSPICRTTHVWLSLRQAGNVKKCLKFNNNINVFIFMIMPKHNRFIKM